MKNLRLQAAREAANKTQAQLAAEAGVTVRAYQYYEAGVKDPTVSVAIRIANALNVLDLREIFGGGDNQ